MIDVTHDGYDGSAWYEVLLVVLLFADSRTDFSADVFCGEAELFCNEVDGLGIHSLVDADHDADAHAGSDNLRDRHVHHRSQLVGRNELCQLEYLAFCCFVGQFLLHSLTDGFALFTTIFGALAHLGALAGKAGKRFAYLLCDFFLAHFGLQRHLLGLVLLFLLAATILVLLLSVAAILLLTLLLVCNVIDVNTFLAQTYALLLVTTLSFEAFATALFVRLLFGASRLVQAVEVNLTLDGKRRSVALNRVQAEDFFLLLLCWSRFCRFLFWSNNLFLSNRLFLLNDRLFLLLRSRLGFLFLFDGFGFRLLFFDRFSLCSFLCLCSLSTIEVDVSQNLRTFNLWSFYLHLFNRFGLGRFLALLLVLANVLLNELCCFVAQSLIQAEFALQLGILLFSYLIVGIGLNIGEAFLLEELNSRLQSDVELLRYFI